MKTLAIAIILVSGIAFANQPDPQAEEITRLQNVIAELILTNRQLREQVQTLETEKTVLQNQNQTLKKQLQTLEAEKTVLQNQNQTLKKQLQTSEPVATEEPKREEGSTADALLERIRKRAAEEWPDNYEMQAYTIKNETKALIEFSRLKTAQGVPDDVMARLRAQAIREWPDQYGMMLYTLKNQIEAYRKLQAK